MRTKCCRSLPRCATCPVVLAARARMTGGAAEGDLFALLRAGTAPRELPVCVRDALATLDDRRRFVRDGRD
jgi:hypothetical protein